VWASQITFDSGTPGRGGGSPRPSPPSSKERKKDSKGMEKETKMGFNRAISHVGVVLWFEAVARRFLIKVVLGRRTSADRKYRRTV